jgi:hypothetical protein
MPPENLITDLTNEFRKFLDNFEKVCRIRIESRNLRYQFLNGILKRIIEALDKEAQNAIREATEAWLDNDNNNLILEALTAELRFFNDLVDNEGAGSGEAPDAAATVKESFEEVLNQLPEWIKKLLKILNEILSLVR